MLIFAESYGVVYRFSLSKWRAMLKAVAAGGVVDYDDYGKCVVNTIDYHITNLDPEMAKEILQTEIWRK